MGGPSFVGHFVENFVVELVPANDATKIDKSLRHRIALQHRIGVQIDKVHDKVSDQVEESSRDCPWIWLEGGQQELPR